jgi:hypothetical protein
MENSHLLEKTAQHRSSRCQKYIKLLKNQICFEQLQLLDQNE